MEKVSFAKRIGKERLETVYDLLFVTPQLTLYLCFTIISFFVAIPMILTDRTSFLDQTVKFVGLKNFVLIFQKPFVTEFLEALQRSIIFLFLNYSTVFIFGLTFALLMYEYTAKYKRSFFTVIYLPYMISGLGAGMLLMLLFGKDTGYVNLLLTDLGLISEPLDIKSKTVTTFALPILTGWRYAGLNMAFFLGGLLSIPTDTVEAAVVDGANYRQKLRYIYLPQIIPSIVSATVLCLIGSFNIFDELVGLGALYGNQNAVLMSVFVYKKGFTVGLAQSVTVSMLVFVPLIIIAFMLTRWQKKQQY